MLAAALALGPVSRADARGLPPQGVYESCDIQFQADACAERLATIGRAGFRVVLNYQALSADRAHVVAYAQAARRASVRLIWPMKDTPWWGGGGRSAYPLLAAECGCDDDAGFLRSTVALLRRLPATWGYYVGDETPPAYAGAVHRLGRMLRRLDPAHRRLYVAEGSDLARDLAPFAGAADVLGADWYTIGTPTPLASLRTVSRDVRRLAARRGKAAAVVVQAFSWGQYPDTAARLGHAWPTRTLLRRQRDLALAGGRPRLLLWYSYFDIARSSDPAGHWRDLVWAAFG